MKKILIFIITFVLGFGNADAAVRDGNSTSRGIGGTVSGGQQRVATIPKPDRTITPRTTVLGKSRTVTKSTTTSRDTNNGSGIVSRATVPVKSVTARVAASSNTITETRTGAQYEACKTAYFTCMDQFCSLKNDDYRRCSCSNRIDSLAAERAVLTSAGEKLTVFTESLDVVGMTAAQATAMRTASEGENALTSDTSASKALLQAIMNSISGGDTTVGGKYSDLNSINMSFDTSTSFGNDSSQVVASYNGQDLYSAVYPQCRNAVREDCNDASLQRAVTAYLMAIEQDCNTVQTAIEQKQREIKSAVRESSALLDLARVENRQKHNSDDITTCINNIESAILSEEVCGANYHKCLDNGEFIDISTGAPITGVVKFYELGNLLKFNDGTDVAMQKLSKISRNKSFVTNFEKRTKKFAEPALSKCSEIADDAWSEYLDKAMLAIYYAQQSKVSEIQQGCFDFVSKCYDSSDTSITMAMSQLMGDSSIVLQPDKVTLSTKLCNDYVASCNNMFDNNIIEKYVEMRETEDVLAACRAVVRQCFDKYGGTEYENFYYPYSGLFERGKAPDWFALYDTNKTSFKSPCAQQLADIDSCRDKEILEKAFGGFDVISAILTQEGNTVYFQENRQDPTAKSVYGLRTDNNTKHPKVRHRELRPVGVATEIYNQIIDTLSTQCMNINGRFIGVQFLQNGVYSSKNYCEWHDTTKDTGKYALLRDHYGISSGENMCPRDYSLSVDTASWGACSCWGNGGRRSQNGRTATCVDVLPTSDSLDNGSSCSGKSITFGTSSGINWCTQSQRDSTNRVCPMGYKTVLETSAENDVSESDEQSESADNYACKPADENDTTDTSYITELVPEGI